MREALDETLDSLRSPAALEALDADPYWPKWDGPWWRILLLHEMGLSHEIPEAIVERLVESLARHLLPTFPFRVEDVPPGKDPVANVACHCQLGCVYQVLHARGVDVDARLPWIRPWFLRYQLPDGGLNCDEAAYTKPVPRSSIVSTLPALEAILLGTTRPFTPEETRFLDRGAQYLIERRLWRSVSRGGAVIDESWAKLCFPRFYFYDLLRGLTFLVRHAKRLERPLPLGAMAEALEILRAAGNGGLARDGQLAPGRRAFEGTKTRWRDKTGAWHRGDEARLAGSFPLLDAVSAPGAVSPFLTRDMEEVHRATGDARWLTPPA